MSKSLKINEEFSSSSNGPLFKDQGFEMYYFEMITYLEGIGGRTGVPRADRPPDYENVPGLTPSQNEKKREKREDEQKDWDKDEKKCYSAVIQSTARHDMSKLMLYNFHRNHQTVHGVNSVPRALDMLNHLRDTYQRVSLDTLEVAETELKEIKIEAFETMTHYVARLDDAFAKVMTYGGTMNDNIKRKKICNGLRNGETSLVLLSQSLKMANLSIVAMYDFCRNFDSTEEGRERLLRTKTRTMPEVSFIAQSKGINKKRKRGSLLIAITCGHCNKEGRSEKDCWQAHRS